MRRSLVAVIGVLLVVALLATSGVTLWGVLSEDDAEPARPEPPIPSVPSVPAPSAEAGVRDPASPDLRRFYDQQVDWRTCREDFECTEVEVPLDYQQPAGETIELALLRRPAPDARARLGSLVVNPGGPGSPGTSYAAQAELVFRDPLLDGFDIVGFDPRGTGDSSPVDCLSDVQLDDYVALDPTPDDTAEQRALTRAVRVIGRGCVARSGDLAAHVSTVEAARDLDVIRAVLEESTLSYFGASYGTKLGATYAELFPERVGRLVLDGAVDLSLPPRRLSLEQAAGFETALRAYAEDCLEATEACFLGEDVDEAIARIAELLDEIDARPLPTDSGRRLRVGNAFYGIVAPLYVEDYWFLLSSALRSAIGGDGSALLMLSDAYTSRGPDGYLDNSMEALYAISCLDDPYAFRPAQVPEAIPAFERASPTFGRVFAWGLIGCSGIEVEATTEVGRVRAEGADPIVVIGTTRDPATPYRWAEALAEQLESGVLVSRDGDGHTGYNAGNDCVDDAVHAYLLSGEVPEDGLAC